MRAQMLNGYGNNEIIKAMSTAHKYEGILQTSQILKEAYRLQICVVTKTPGEAPTMQLSRKKRKS